MVKAATPASRPTKVPSLGWTAPVREVQGLYMGGSWICALAQGYTANCWQRQTYGVVFEFPIPEETELVAGAVTDSQLCLGTDDGVLCLEIPRGTEIFPEKAQRASGMTQVSTFPAQDIVAGRRHFCLLGAPNTSEQGAVYCWRAPVRPRPSSPVRPGSPKRALSPKLTCPRQRPAWQQPKTTRARFSRQATCIAGGHSPTGTSRHCQNSYSWPTRKTSWPVSHPAASPLQDASTSAPSWTRFTAVRLSSTMR